MPVSQPPPAQGVHLSRIRQGRLQPVPGVDGRSTYRPRVLCPHFRRLWHIAVVVGDGIRCTPLNQPVDNNRGEAMVQKGLPLGAVHAGKIGDSSKQRQEMKRTTLANIGKQVRR